TFSSPTVRTTVSGGTAGAAGPGGITGTAGGFTAGAGCAGVGVCASRQASGVKKRKSCRDFIHSMIANRPDWPRGQGYAAGLALRLTDAAEESWVRAHGDRYA